MPKIKPLRRRVSPCCGGEYKKTYHGNPGDKKVQFLAFMCMNCGKSFKNPVPKFPKKEKK